MKGSFKFFKVLSLVSIISVFATQHSAHSDTLELDGSVQAVTGTGVGLKDDSGTVGVWVEDGGQVGINTTSPDEALHVSGSSNGFGAHIGNAYMGVWDSNSGYAVFTHNNLKGVGSSYALLQSSGGTTYLNAASGYSLHLRNGNATKQIIDGSGRVGVGTTSPGSYHTDANGFVIYNPGNSGMTIATDANSDKSSIFFADNNSGSGEYNGFIQYDHVNDQMTYGIKGAAHYFAHEGTGAIKINKRSGTVYGTANEAKIYAEQIGSTTEMRVVDSAGNHTTISPHNFELFTPDENEPAPWAYYSINPLTGKKINVDMAGAIRAIERLTNEQFIYTADLDSTEKVSVAEWQTSCTQQLVHKIQSDQVRKTPWVEIDVSEAIIDVPETTTTAVMVTSTRYVLNPQTGQIDQIQEEKEEIQTVLTGNTVKQLKEGYQLDETTGKCYRPCVPADVTLTQEQLNEIDQAIQLPQYVTARIAE